MIENLSWLPYVVEAVIVGMPAVIGTALIVIAARRWWRMRALAASGQRATATVVDNQMESWSDGRMSFLPVVTFPTATGQQVRTVLADLGGSRSHLVDTKIEVFYDPEKPDEAAPVRKGGARLVVMLVFGLLFLAFALAAYLLADMIISEVDGFPAGPGPAQPGEPGFDLDKLDVP